MKQNTIAIIYDFDGTLTPKTMQEYTLLPKLGVKSKSFWDEISQEVSKTGAETITQPDGQKPVCPNDRRAGSASY